MIVTLAPWKDFSDEVGVSTCPLIYSLSKMSFASWPLFVASLRIAPSLRLLCVFFAYFEVYLHELPQDFLDFSADSSFCSGTLKN